MSSGGIPFRFVRILFESALDHRIQAPIASTVRWFVVERSRSGRVDGKRPRTSALLGSMNDKTQTAEGCFQFRGEPLCKSSILKLRK